MKKELAEEIKKYIENNRTPLADGYVRFLSLNSIEKITDIVSDSDIWNDGIPFATTVFGDILAWEDGYVVMYDFTMQDYNVINSGAEFFFSNLKDVDYQNDYFDMDVYREAVEKLGAVNEDECYSIEPLPVLGGERSVKYLNRSDLNEYIKFLVS